VALTTAPRRIPKKAVPMAALIMLSISMSACVSAEKTAGLGEVNVPADPRLLTADKTHRPQPDMATASAPPQPAPAETVAQDGQPALPGQIMMETRVAASRRSIFASEPTGDTDQLPAQTDPTMAYAAPRTMNPVHASLFGGTPAEDTPQDEATPASTEKPPAEQPPTEQPIVPLTAEESQAYDDPVVTVPAKGQMESADPAPADIAPAQPKKKAWSIGDLFAGFHKKKTTEPVK
jgi:hypothetical protein